MLIFWLYSAATTLPKPTSIQRSSYTPIETPLIIKHSATDDLTTAPLYPTMDTIDLYVIPYNNVIEDTSVDYEL